MTMEKEHFVCALFLCLFWDFQQNVVVDDVVIIVIDKMQKFEFEIEIMCHIISRRDL
jgi:hypothetical protein